MAQENKTQYLHIRNLNADEQPDSRGGATYAYRVVDNKLEFGAAYCTLNDNFNKKIGRQIAESRMATKRPFDPDFGPVKWGVMDFDGEVVNGEVKTDDFLRLVIDPQYKNMDFYIGKVGRVYTAVLKQDI